MRAEPSPRQSPARDAGRHDSGMTLIELLVVLVIVALVASFAVPRLMGYVGGARADTASVQIKRLSGILELYRLEVGAYPSTEAGLSALVSAPPGEPRWNGPYLQNADALVDPWGAPYRYRAPGEHGDYDLYTLGADGLEGGEGEDADVANWTPS
ncbi:MAG: type II secretion system major pseudopilin GspG [Paracoccaceae bacterium]